MTDELTKEHRRAKAKISALMDPEPPGATYVESAALPPWVPESATAASLGGTRFGARLRKAAEEGLLLFAKHALYLGLWLGSGYLVWREVNVLRSQAQAGMQAFQYLTTGEKYKAIDALLPKPLVPVQPSGATGAAK